MSNKTFKSFLATILLTFGMTAAHIVQAVQLSPISDQFVFQLVTGGTHTDTFTLLDETNAQPGTYLASSLLNAANVGTIGDYQIVYESDGTTISDYVGIVSDGNGGATFAVASDPMDLPTAFTNLVNVDHQILNSHIEFPVGSAPNWEEPAYWQANINSPYLNATVVSSGVFRSDVPEPATFVLFSLGLAGMAFGMHRKLT